MGGGLVAVLVFGLIFVAFRWAMGGIDKGRVEQYVLDRGGKLLDARWAPFGPGWFGERSDRIYEVKYMDKEGNTHLAHCKTSMMTGVYFTEDNIIETSYRAASTPDSRLADENRRLRDELARLKGKQQ